MIFQVVKSIVLFGLMYGSLKYLGISEGSALVISTIPLVLGLIGGVMTGLASIIAGLVFVLAAFSVLLPAKYHNAMEFVEKISGDTEFNKVDLNSDKNEKDDTNNKK